MCEGRHPAGRQFGSHALGRLTIHIEHMNGSACGCQSAGNCLADAVSGPCHQTNTTIEKCHRTVPCSVRQMPYRSLAREAST
jgi:hypothetical protein